ncbi:MAG: DUF1588 domain-containing protein [Gemmataceae bacterium]
MLRQFLRLMLCGTALLSLPRSGPSQTLADLKFASAADSRAEYDRAVRPFLAKHCLTCHSSMKPKGDLDLSTLAADMKTSTSGARWAMVAKRLKEGDMPPRERPRPEAASIAAVLNWAHAEAKRANKHFTRREAYANGNVIPHEILFDAKNVPPFDGGPRIRRLSPEIYAAFTGELAKGKSGIGQPFSPEGKTTFKDMGAPKMDEPVTAQLIQNALAIVEVQTAHKIEGGAVKGSMPREFLALFDPATPPTETHMEEAIARQFETILRRTPTASERQRFLALMKKNIADAGQTVGVRYTLAAVLLLPEAVFRMEVGNGKADEKGRLRLSPREIAFALAYALTDKRPDAALLAAAATGELDTDAGVAKQVRRLLDDSKVDQPRILRFFREYFNYDQADEVFKDTKASAEGLAHPGHDARALVEDTDQLVLYILERDKEVLRELLTTNLSFVGYKNAATIKKQRADAIVKFEADKKKNPEKFKNKELKLPGKSIYESYGLADFPDQQPVALPAKQRAGILTQPSWLVSHSTSFDNHAIHRGKWIRERLLGNVVPDIPITVDAQLPVAPEKTLRERMAVTQQANCWKCHQLMNDLAYPFEQYDHFGRFRTQELVQDLQATAKNLDKKGKPLGPVYRGAPLNTSGLIAHVGDSQVEGAVNNPLDLMKQLAGSERVEQVFVRHAFRYWLGRNEAPGDAASLQAAHQAYRQQGGSMKALIVSLLSSESFLYRVPESAEANHAPANLPRRE